MNLDDLVDSYFGDKDDKELFTLTSLNILYEDKDIVVVNKSELISLGIPTIIKITQKVPIK